MLLNLGDDPSVQAASSSPAAWPQRDKRIQAAGTEQRVILRKEKEEQ